MQISMYVLVHKYISSKNVAFLAYVLSNKTYYFLLSLNAVLLTVRYAATASMRDVSRDRCKKNVAEILPLCIFDM